MGVLPSATPRPTIKIRKQLATCIGMSVLALALIYSFQNNALQSIALSGISIGLQISFALVIGFAAAIVSYVGFKLQSKRAYVQQTIEGYSRLDLRGWNPLWISLAAGFGEELLFRAALQPLLGIWFASVIFVLAHIPAYQFKSLSLTILIQACGIFAASLFLGVVFEYVGLIAAMLVHTSIDIVGLYSIRRASRTLQV